MWQLQVLITIAWTLLSFSKQFGLIEVMQRSCASMAVRPRLTIKAKGGLFETLSVHYDLSLLLNSCVEETCPSLSGIIFLRAFRRVNFSGPPCIITFKVA